MAPWRDITMTVNALGVVLRTEDDLKKKWRDLKYAIIISHKNLADAYVYHRHHYLEKQLFSKSLKVCNEIEVLFTTIF